MSYGIRTGMEFQAVGPEMEEAHSASLVWVAEMENEWMLLVEEHNGVTVSVTP